MSSSSLNNIYSIGHQTLDVTRARFLENNILSEQKSRTKLYNRNIIDRDYDPILQIEKHTETIGTYKNNDYHHDKEKLSTTYRENLNKLIDNTEDLRNLEHRKKMLSKEIHLMNKTFGNSKLRDLSIHLNPKNIEIVPSTSSYYDKLQLIKSEQQKHQKQFIEDEELYAIMKKNKEIKYKNSDKETLPVKPITPEKFDTAIQSFGGTKSLSSTQFLNVHEPNKNFKNNYKNNKIPYKNNITDYNSVVLQHNKLLSIPRPPRNTLMLSGMGFTEHCTDVALEIVKILNEKNL